MSVKTESIEHGIKNKAYLFPLAKKAYNDAIAAHYYPSLPPPRIIFDEDLRESFYIDNRTWTITLNIANIPRINSEKEIYTYYFSLSLHEIGHYVLIPYDNYTNTRLMLEVARAGIPDANVPIVTNIFTDLILDEYLHKNFKKEMEYEFTVSTKERLESNEEKSPLWLYLICTYDYLWDLGLIKNYDIPRNIKILAKKTSKLIKHKTLDESTWPKKAYRLAEIVKGFFSKNSTFKQSITLETQSRGSNGQNKGKGMKQKGEGEQGEGGQGENKKGEKNGKEQEKKGKQGEGRKEEEKQGKEKGKKRKKEKGEGKQKGDKGGIGTQGSTEKSKGERNRKKPKSREKKREGRLPSDVVDQFGDLGTVINYDRIKNPDESSEIEEKNFSEEELETLIEQLPENYSFEEFVKLINIFQELKHDKALALWYRAKTRDLIRIEAKARKQGESQPIYPEIWRLGEPLEDLNLYDSLMVSPIIIPNITTRKWKKIGTLGREYNNEAYPDLLIIIDSSGSMSAIYHLALLASFAAYQYALKRGASISVINFSSNYSKIEWTTDRNKIEQCLLNFFGGGTTLPTRTIKEIMRKRENPALILMISDMGLSNLDKSIKVFTELLYGKNRLILFLIGWSNEEVMGNLGKSLKDLKEKNIKLIPIKEEEDLVGLVINEVYGAYN